MTVEAGQPGPFLDPKNMNNNPALMDYLQAKGSHLPFPGRAQTRTVEIQEGVR